MYATERLRKDQKREGGTEIVVVAPPVLAGSSRFVIVWDILSYYKMAHPFVRIVSISTYG